MDFGADPATAICMLGLGRPFLRPKKKAAYVTVYTLNLITMI